MNIITWEWVAGFFEGEGNIFYQEGKHGTKQGMHGRATMGQKDKRALQAIYDFLVENGFSAPSFILRPAYVNTKSFGRSCEMWILTINRRDDVIRFYREISPFLFEKQSKAVFVLSHLEKNVSDRNLILEEAISMKNSGVSWREIARRLGIGRVSINNYLRSANIVLKKSEHFEDRMSWRKSRNARGLCDSCGKERGKDGTKMKCRACADRYNSMRQKYEKNKSQKLVKP